MKYEIELHQLICTVATARHTYHVSKTVLDREVFRRWYMLLGTIVHDESEMMERRQKALDAMHRLQLTLL
ncbi:hypothetical protein KJJ67_004465 [Salmonella enterica]|nr:hypothetical protein [Salmonella enterica]